MKKGLKKPMNQTRQTRSRTNTIPTESKHDKISGKIGKLHFHIKNLMKYTKIFHSSKKIYSILVKVYGETKQKHTI